MNKISEIKIKNLTDAEKMLKIIEDRKIPVIGTCSCLVSIYTKFFNSAIIPTCVDKHIILIPERYKDCVMEILQNIEEGRPFLY